MNLYDLEESDAQSTVPLKENMYQYNGKEHETSLELHWYDYGARQYDVQLGRWNGVDPLADEKPSWTPFRAFFCNPVYWTDPTGLLETDGWVEDLEGNVSWDSETNSQSDFDANYKGKEGYSYVSDADDSRSYTLPSGEGKVTVKEWTTYEVEDGVGGVSIELEFTPSEEGAEVGWVQTFSSNQIDVNSETLWTKLPSEEMAERLDGYGVQESTDLSKARYISNNGGDYTSENGIPESSFSDQPTRFLHKDAKTNVRFKAQSTAVVNGKSAVSVGWGFTIDSSTTGTSSSPTILKSTTNFHKSAVQSVIDKIK